MKRVSGIPITPSLHHSVYRFLAHADDPGIQPIEAIPGAGRPGPAAPVHGVGRGVFLHHGGQVWHSGHLGRRCIAAGRLAGCHFWHLVLLVAGEMGLSADDAGVRGGAVRHPLETIAGKMALAPAPAPALARLGIHFGHRQHLPKVDRAGAGSFFGLRGVFLFGVVRLARGAESLAGLGRAGPGALLGAAYCHGPSTLAAWRRSGR